MILLAYIWWILLVACVSVLAHLFGYYTDVDIYGWMFLFFIPIWSLFLWWVSVTWLFFIKRKLHVRFYKIDYLVTFVLAVLGLVLFHYISYMRMTIDIWLGDSTDTQDMTWIVATTESYDMPLRLFATFPKYLSVVYTQSSYSLTATSNDPVELWSIATKALLWWQILGLILSSMTLCFLCSRRLYCKDCNRYYEEYLIKDIWYEDFVNKIRKVLQSEKKADTLLDHIDGCDTMPHNGKTAEMILHYCDRCFAWFIEMTCCQYDQKGKLIGLLEDNSQFPLPSYTVESLVNKLSFLGREKIAFEHTWRSISGAFYRFFRRLV